MRCSRLDWYLPNHTEIEIWHSLFQKSLKSTGHILIGMIRKINHKLNMVKNYNAGLWSKKINEKNKSYLILKADNFALEVLIFLT